MRLTRRTLLMFGLLGTGAVACRKWSAAPQGSASGPSAKPAAVDLHPLLTLDDDNGITVLIARTEMGQGVSTALPWILAQALDVDWNRVRMLHHRFERSIPMQGTSASSGIHVNYAKYRHVGAAARDALIAAAAGLWSVSASEVTARGGLLAHAASGRQARYVDVAALVPEGAVIAAAPREFAGPIAPMPARPSLDVHDKSTGRAVFGADIRLPGLAYAALRRAPHGQTVTAFSDEAARRVPGFRRAFATATGVACLADTTWAAHRASQALVLELGGEPSPPEDLAQQFAARWQGAALETIRETGDGRAASRAGHLAIEQAYRFPLLAHAALEPMTATARVQDGTVEIWAPMQSPGLTVATVAGQLGIAPEQVTVHKTLVGGGFGRKVYQDVIASAVEIARHVEGQPVQLTLTREQDFASDYFRPGSEHRLAASISAEGVILGWHHQVVGPSVLAWYPPKAEHVVKDFLSFSGVGFDTYSIPDFLAEGASFPTRTRVGIWRSIGHSASCYVNETTIDLLARRAGLDPVAVRMRNLPAGGRMQAVLARAAELAEWSGRDASQRPMGAAIFQEIHPPGQAGTPAYEVYVAHVVELAPVVGGRLKLSKITCVVDCGEVICPDLVRAQFEGAVTWALTGLFNEIDTEAAASEAINFHRYLPTRMADIPPIRVEILRPRTSRAASAKKACRAWGPPSRMPSRMPRATRSRRCRGRWARWRRRIAPDARSGLPQPLTHTTWRKVCTTSTSADCAAITSAIGL